MRAGPKGVGHGLSPAPIGPPIPSGPATVEAEDKFTAPGQPFGQGDPSVAFTYEAEGARMLAMLTLMQAGLPLAKARSSAGCNCSGRSTNSPCAPSSAATRS